MQAELIRESANPLIVYDIEIANKQESLELDDALLRALTQAALRSERIEAARISIAIVNDPLMHELNRRHLNHDYPTDVLSFLLHSDSPDSNFSHLKQLEGEVIVSADTAIREANNRQVNPLEELALYLVHGLLHLCGYDDHCDADIDEMRKRERSILSQFNINPTYE